MGGRFITFEGIDGAGKSTCLEVVRGVLEGAGIDVLTTREPGGTVVGEGIRQLLLSRSTRATAETESLLVFAARQEHLATVVYPALEQERWVLCDRFTDATYAYQGGGRGLPLERLDVLRHWVHGGFEPDLTILVDADPDTAGDRLRSRGNELDRFEIEARAFHERVRQTYLDLARQYPERIRVIGAHLPVDERDATLSALVRGLGASS